MKRLGFFFSERDIGDAVEHLKIFPLGEFFSIICFLQERNRGGFWGYLCLWY